MPRLEDAQQLLPSSSNIKSRTRNAWDGFSDFALRDNVLEVAVGLMSVNLSLLFPHTTASYPAQEKRKGDIKISSLISSGIFSVAAAFTTVISSFVSDIILPPISLLPFFSRNLEEKFAVLKQGPRYKDVGYNTLEQAKDDGAVVMAYGCVVSPFSQSKLFFPLVCVA